MQENLGKRVLSSITAWEPLMMLGAVGLSLIRQLRKQTLTKQSFWRIAFFNYVNNLMDQWQQRQIGCFLIRGKYDLAIKWLCHNSTSLWPKTWKPFPHFLPFWQTHMVLFIRCASISWFEVVSKSASDSPFSDFFTASAYTGLSELFDLVPFLNSFYVLSKFWSFLKKNDDKTLGSETKLKSILS